MNNVLKSVSSWVFGIIFILLSIGLMTTSVLLGLATLILSCLFFPPIQRWVKHDLNHEYGAGTKVIAALVIFALLIVVDLDGSPSHSAVQDSQQNSQLTELVRGDEEAGAPSIYAVTGDSIEKRGVDVGVSLGHQVKSIHSENRAQRPVDYFREDVIKEGTPEEIVEQIIPLLATIYQSTPYMSASTSALNTLVNDFGEHVNRDIDMSLTVRSTDGRNIIDQEFNPAIYIESTQEFIVGRVLTYRGMSGTSAMLTRKFEDVTTRADEFFVLVYRRPLYANSNNPYCVETQETDGPVWDCDINAAMQDENVFVFYVKSSDVQDRRTTTHPN